MSVVANLTKPCLEPIEFQQIQKYFSDSAKTYKTGAQLQHKVGESLLNNLLLNTFENNNRLTCVDLGCGPWLFTQRLNKQFNKVIGLDLACDMLRANTTTNLKVQANSHSLPFLHASVDVFYSSLMVQWCDLNQVLTEVHQCLKPNGKAFVATLVDGTLFELEHAWSRVDSDKHIHNYLTAEQLSYVVDTLPWSNVSLNKQTEQFWFSDAKMLAKELKCLGANFVQNRKNKGLITRSVWQQMEQAYQAEFYNDQKQAIPATYKIMYLELTK